MKKTIAVGAKNIELESTALTSVAYKKIFGSDVLAALNKDRGLQNDINLNDSIKQLAFVMAKQAEGLSVPELLKLQELDFYEWINGYEYGDLEAVIPEIIGVWTANLHTEVEAKNAEGAQQDR